MNALVFTGSWEPLASPPAATPPVPVRIVTWNTWFGGHMFDERAVALLAELERQRPDVIALQEVTPELLARIIDEPWVRASYQLSDATGETIWDYGVILMSRLPMRAVRILDLPSRMGRRLVVGELACGLVVATVHLESTRMCIRERAHQLRIIQPYLASLGPDTVLVGDMNFAPGDLLENEALDPTFVDAWPALELDAGFTVDSMRNAMGLLVNGGKVTRKRIDRVFVRGSRWRAAAIEQLGTAPIDDVETYISDHFGLAATLAI